MINFRKDNAILFDSEIVIALHVTVEGNNDRVTDDIASEQSMVMTIPLSEQTITIDVEFDGVNNNEVIINEDTNLLVTGLFYLISLICFLVAIDIALKAYRLISKISFNKSTYARRLDKIMREYGQVIIETKSAPNIPRDMLYKITSFEELLDLHTELQKPIMFMKIHNEKSCFMITDGDKNYQFIMKASDLEKDKK